MSNGQIVANHDLLYRAEIFTSTGLAVKWQGGIGGHQPAIVLSFKFEQKFYFY